MRRAIALTLALLLSACMRESPEPEQFADDQNGTARVALTARASDGTTYVLRDSTVEISGSALLTLSPRSADDESLTTPLPSGSYSLFLRPGYRVVALAADGSERVVAAQLVSANPRRFALRPLEDALVKLTFAIADERVVFGGTPALRVTSVFSEPR
jgi:hypothetical protein